VQVCRSWQTIGTLRLARCGLSGVKIIQVKLVKKYPIVTYTTLYDKVPKHIIIEGDTRERNIIIRLFNTKDFVKNY